VARITAYAELVDQEDAKQEEQPLDETELAAVLQHVQLNRRIKPFSTMLELRNLTAAMSGGAPDMPAAYFGHDDKTIVMGEAHISVDKLRYSMTPSSKSVSV
jgi:hypothetical protein